jgi:spore maturation protein A
MVNIIWGLFIVIGIVYGLFTGNISVINNEIIESGNKAIKLVLDILPLLVIWMGLMKIAETSGLIKKIASLMTPLLSKLFPSVPKGDESLGFIASNIAINMAGLGSAATPFGLKAMAKLQELNQDKKRATTAMITFLVLNTSGVTIIPTTIIALRLSAGSTNPTAVLPTCILATTCSTIAGLTLDYIIRRHNGNH